MTVFRMNNEQNRIQTPDPAVYRQARKMLDGIAKPIDSLGDFEDIYARICAMKGTLNPDITDKTLIVMCADNGITEEGVTQTDSSVTAKVAAAMGMGKSNVCRMAAVQGVHVLPADIGIAEKESIPGVLDRKVREGTRNFLKEPALTEAEAREAVEIGIQLARDCCREGTDILLTGEMGIGNTTTSSALSAVFLDLPVPEVTGRGAGLSDAGLSRKNEVIAQAVRRYGLRGADPMKVVCCVGGLDIAGLAGVFIGGAMERCPVVIDGAISAAAALTAERLCPGTSAYMLASHAGKERMTGKILEALGLKPVIDAGLALGEGSGSVLYCALLDAAFAALSGPLRFEEIQVEAYERME